MLTAMRALSKGFIAKIFMGCIIVMFCVWGVGDVIRNGGGASYAAKVGHETISVNEFQRHRAMVARSLEGMGMAGVDANKLSVAGLRQLVQERLILAAMHDMGLFVDDDLLAQSLRNIPELKNKDGSFNKTAFAANLQNQQMSEATFLDQLRNETAGRFMTDSLSMDDAVPPASVIALDALAIGETRDVALITIPAGTATSELTDETLKDFYEKNKSASYLLPETRTLQYVTLNQSDIDALAAKSVSDDMVKEAMAAAPKASKAEIMKRLTAEQRDNMVRTVSNTVEDEMAAGKTLGEAFAKAGITTEPRTLENVSAESAKTAKDEVTKTVEEQGFTLSEGEVSGLVSTPKGTLLMVAVKSIHAAEPKSFETVKADLKKRLLASQAKQDTLMRAINVKEALAKGPDWHAAIAEQKVGSRMLNGLKRPEEGKPNPNDPLPGGMHQQIFEHEIGGVAGPYGLPNGDQLLAVVTGIHYPKISPAAVSKADASAQTAKLSQDVQNNALNAFMIAHPIKVNPALMQPEKQP